MTDIYETVLFQRENAIGDKEQAMFDGNCEVFPSRDRAGKLRWERVGEEKAGFDGKGWEKYPQIYIYVLLSSVFPLDNVNEAWASSTLVFCRRSREKRSSETELFFNGKKRQVK